MNRNQQATQRLSVLAAMVKHNGHQSKAAMELGIHRTTINYLLARFRQADEAEVDLIMGKNWTGEK